MKLLSSLILCILISVSSYCLLTVEASIPQLLEAMGGMYNKYTLHEACSKIAGYYSEAKRNAGGAGVVVCCILV
jgi:hypothetical protein